MYDGEIRINTKVDTSGINKGTSSINNGLKGINSMLLKTAGLIGVAFGIKALIDFGRKSVEVASQTQSAMIGLQSIIEGQGRSWEQANEFINEYISDGLIPATEAVTAYKNLAMRGYTDVQIEQTLQALKDSASFGRQASLSLGQAVASASEGLKNENSILVDNAGVTKNVSMMWKDYAENIGTTVNNLTKQQKIQAEVNGILEETRFQTGDASRITETYQGQTLKLGFAFTNLRIAVGNAIMPLAQVIIPVITEIITWLTRLFNTFAQVTSAIFGTAKASEQVANNINAGADAQKDLANATKKANKQSKEQLASWDKINVLTKETEDVSVETDIDFGGIGKLGQVLEEPPKILWIEDLKDSLDSLIKWMDINFSPIFEDIIDNMQPNIVRFKNIISTIFTDIGTLGQPLKDWFNNDFTPFLQQSLETQGIIINGLFDSFNMVFQDIWDIVIFPAVSMWVTNILPILTQFATEFTKTFETIFIETKRIFDTLWSEAIAPGLGLITDIWADMWLIITDLWNTYGQPIFDLIRDAIQTTADVFLTIWENFLKPIFDNIMDTVDWLWTKHLQPLIKNIGEFVAELVTLALVIYNEFIAPIVKWLLEVFGPTFANIFGYVFNIVSIIVAGIIDVVGGIITVIKGIIQFITGVFTGDWKKAWEGIKNIFKGIVDTLWGILKVPINLIINGLNFLIRGIASLLSGAINLVIGGINAMLRGILAPLNLVIDALNMIPGTNIGKLSFAIPSVPNWGANVYQIPKLATGTVLPGGNPFMAIVNDQPRGQTNIEAPLDTIKQALREVQDEGGTPTTTNSTQTFIIQLGTNEFGRFTINAINQVQESAGVTLLKV